jgi:ATP-dependent Clp protease ATP-binding subunit ClpA
MGEYIEEHAVSRLLGAPPGYMGSEDEGRLTGAVRAAPYSVVLFDEIEKAHPRIFDIFLPILDEGRLKDSRGRNVSFKNCLIILTSNIGAETLAKDHTADRRHLVDELSRHFRPEFLNRVDEIVPFYPLLFEDIRAILLLLIKDLTKRLLQQKYDLRMYQKANEYLAEKGYSAEFGARELKRTVDQLIANPIGERIVSIISLPAT